MTDHTVRPDVHGLLEMLKAIGGPEMSAMPLAEARAAYVAMKDFGEAEPRDLAVIRDLTCPGPAGDIPLRFYDARETREAGPVVIFFHGGGFVIGDLETHHALCSEIAAGLDLPVVAVDYRLAPEHPFPAAPDDAEAAARWLAGSPAELGRVVTGLIPLGDSAGGNLAIVITQALMAAPAAAPVVLQVPLYPWADERLDHASMAEFGEGFLLSRAVMDWFAEAYAAQPGHPRAHTLNGNHAAMPPTVLVTAGLDPIRDGGRAYGAALIAAGSDVMFIELKGTIHGFATLRKALPSAAGDMARIFAAVKLMLT